MIEVEKKFVLNEQDKGRLTKDAQFISERVFTDIYYDTENFFLTSKDKWLRCREGRFELKLPLHDGVDRLADQYDELEDEQQIKQALHFFSTKILPRGLRKLDISHFARVKQRGKNIKKSHSLLTWISLIYRILPTTSEKSN